VHRGQVGRREDHARLLGELEQRKTCWFFTAAGTAFGPDEFTVRWSEARAPLIASILAHGAFLVLCGRVREQRWLDVTATTDALELELVFTASARREAPRRDEPPPIIVARTQPERLARALARSTQSSNEPPAPTEPAA